ncbi:MAG: polysaccharide biosynthesis C-terminal domain-containing protein, partial [Muribaculaceae bacterium]|nr:polysaccharide biosynthesis C-terminal domain-containing protein [Muribaculaceae bacterium]
MISAIYNRYKAYYMPIARLALPVLVGQLGMIVVGFADNIMVGRYSTEALASASFVNNLFNAVIFFCLGFTYGITPLVGALHARNEHYDIGRMMRSATLLNSIVSILITCLLGIIYFYLDRFGQPDELLPLIRPYYLLYLAGIIPITLFNVFAQWSYGIRNTWMPMVIVLAANILNVGGNYILIYGNLGAPELGLTGAGIATLIAR